MKKPIIGISLGSSILPSTLFGGPETEEDNTWQLTTNNFIQLAFKAGGNPLMLAVIDDENTAKDLWDRLDGIILSGGPDVNPVNYNERNGGKLSMIDNHRDKYELALAKYAIEKDLPILAICRGLQVLNISLGGSVHQDLEEKGYENHSLHNARRREGSHFVNLKKDNPLYDIVGEEKIWVNSYHHQGINKLGKGLKAVGFSEDEVIEAAYMPEKKFVLGLQWHPEYMYDNEITKKIAKSFIEACQK